MPTIIVSLLGIVLGFVGSMPLAGPISIIVVSRSAERRYAEARRVAFGAAVAEGMYACVAFWGFATFLAPHASVLPISHAITAVVLLAVGVHFVRWKGPRGDHKMKPGHRSGFFLGFSLSALNPTLFVTWSAVTTALYSRRLVPANGLLAVPFGIAAGAGVAAWNVVLVSVLQRFANRVPTRVITGAVRGMGVLLVALAAWSAVDLARAVWEKAHVL